MKKQLLQKHRGIFLALLSFLCVISINAATWTPPTFEHQSDDLSSHVGEVFYLYNVGLDAYVTYGADYGTRAVMGPVGYPMYLRASTNSNYKFEFVTSSKHNGVTYDLWHAGGGAVYTDNTTSSDWTCTYDATSKSYIVANTAAAASTYLAPNTTIYSNTANGTAGNGFELGGKYYILMDSYATNDNYTKWRFVTPKQKALLDLSNLFTYVTNNPSLGIDLTSYVAIYNNSASTTTDLTTNLTNLKNAIYATATISNPVEVTSFTIASPSFEFKAISSMDSWVVSTGTIKPTYSTQISGTFPVAGSNFLEYYKGSGNLPAFTLQQTINSLPAGKYSLKAILKGSTGTGTTSPANIKLFAGSYNTSITTTPTTATQYEVPNILTPSDGSSLNIGLQYTTGAAWLATDYFQLYYYGPITSSTTWTSSPPSWSNGTPTADVNAVIPSGNTYDGPGFTCCSLVVEAPTTFTSASTILGNLTLNNTLTVNGAYTLTINGAVSATSSITATDGTVVFNGSCAQQTCPLTGTVANLTINNAAAGGVVLANSTTVSGTLTLSAGTLTNSTYLTLASGATIVRTAGTLSALPTVGTSFNVTYDGSSNITMGNEITGFMNLTKLNNLTVSNAISVSLPATIIVNGNLNLVQSSSVLFLTNAYNITLIGDMPGLGYIEGNGKNFSVNCNGLSAQRLLLTNTTNLNINNSAVTLGRDLTVRGTLALNSNILTTGSNILTLNVATSGTGYIFTGSTGTVVWSSTQTISNLNGAVNNLTVNNTVTLPGNLIVGNTLLINPGKVLSVAAGKQLTATTTLTNSGTLNLLSTAAAGTATILTPATIGGTGGVANVQQYLNSANSSRNWYISSPVSVATSNVFGPVVTLDINSKCLYWYDETLGSNNWTAIIDNATSLTVGKGYIAHIPTASYGTFTFTGGTLNTGSKSISLTSSIANTGFQGFNLVGNPYPSYLNWNLVSTSNAGVSTTMYYKTMSGLTYYVDTYNASGSLPVSASGNTITGYIPPMQAFWVSAPAPGTLSLTNAMRSHSDVSLNLFKAPAANSNSQSVLRLKVSNGTTGDETVIYANANATNGYDNYDSQKMSNNSVSIPEIYTTVDGHKLVIDGLNSIPTNTELPLGFTTGQSNAFSIKASEFSNFDTSTKVYLKDKLLGTETDLTDGTAYTFASDVAATTDRFSVVFKSAGIATSLNNASGDQVALIFKNANNQITVNCKGDISDNAFISVYNALGQKLESKQITSTTTVIGKTFTSGVYVVTVNNGGKNTTKKVILN